MKKVVFGIVIGFYNAKNPYCWGMGFFDKRLGGDLLSHTVTGAVPLAQRVLTTLFGMGRGVSPAIEPPRIFLLVE